MRNKALYSVGAFALLGVLVAASVSAQAPKTDRAADKAAIEQVFRDYVATFVAGDQKKMSTYMNVPVMAVGLDKVLVTATEIEEYVAGVQGNFKSRGYAEFVFDQVAVKLLGQNLAFLSYSGQRRTKDGTVLEKGAGSVFL